MPYPRFTKIIINHFLKQYKSLTNLNHKHYHTIKDDRIVSRLKFVRIVEDYQESGLPIPDVMLTDSIKRSESYQMFIKYSTNQIPPKKSKESEPKPEPTKKKTSSKRRVKKKVTLSANDNIISDDHDVALELAKSISQTEAEEAEAARKVHATHARIITESVSESAKKKSSCRSSKSVLKGAPSLTPQEQEDADIMQALMEIKKKIIRKPGTKGSNEGTGSKTGVPDESTVISAISSEGTGAKPGVPDEDKDITEEKDDKDGDADDEADDHVSDTQDADDEDVETESDEDEIYKYKIRVRNEEDVEMKDAEVEESDKGEEKVTDAAKEEAEKTLEANDDTKKSKLPPSSSSLFVSSDVSYLLDIPIQHETPQTQSPSVQKIPVSVIPETNNLPPIPEIVIETPVLTVVPSPQVTPIFSYVQQTPTPIPTPPITTDALTVTTAVSESNALFAIELRVSKLEKDVSELKTVDHPSEALVRHTADLIHKYSLQHIPELTKKPTPTAEQESEKSPLDIIKIKRE
ncbi:hypothetical protein Tco_1338278 [Tanacetum coccineum]